MMLSEKEKDRIWEELVKNTNERIWSGEERVWRKERVGRKMEWLSDLWLLVIMLVFWISFLSIMEVVGGGC